MSNREISASLSILFVAAVVVAANSQIITLANANDWLIVPGSRVGPIDKNTSEMELRRLFGEKNELREDIGLGEGETEPGTIVFPNSDGRLAILWKDQGQRQTPKEIRLNGDKTRWKTGQGISLGTSLKELEKLNGRPFFLMGFAWDYSGTVIDCNKGNLKELGCTDPKDPNKTLRGRTLLLRLMTHRPVDEMQDKRDFYAVSGERRFSSGHPSMQRLNPRVYEIIIYLTPQDI